MRIEFNKYKIFDMIYYLIKNKISYFMINKFIEKMLIKLC